MMPLTQATEERIYLLFQAADRDKVRTILAEQLEVVFRDPCSTAEGLERIRFAALKLSEGSLDKLKQAVRVANADWRDLLVASGFADDPDAHKSWLRDARRQP
jgi:hypothetical protein